MVICGLKVLFLGGNTGFKEKSNCHAQADVLFLVMYGIATQPRTRAGRAV
jgi:hypothetical protein|tara:strand:+ start:220 stop:369 length:150 start_codon:yes stop_codon:yes gene_type:complete